MTELSTRRWAAIGGAMAAHAAMLRDAGVIGDGALAAVLRGVDAARAGIPPAEVDLLGLVTAFDERAAGLAPAEVAGVLRLGRGDIDVAAAASRVVARNDVIGLGNSLDALRETLLALANAHVVTLLPASIDGQVAQPTTFAHLLGGVLGPLGRAAARLAAATAELDASPLGAGALASSGLPVDRERAAELIGFGGVVVNTFDAVSSLDSFAAAAEAAGAAVRPVRALLEELLAWTRVDPALVQVRDGSTQLLGDLPQARLPGALLAAIAAGRAAERAAEAARNAALDAPFGPSVTAFDTAGTALSAAAEAATAFCGQAAALLGGGLELNRALLANRAGRGFATSSDLAEFLMIEEQIDPASARDIAALTISRTREQGLEASGITPEIIDGAALLVIGREIKAEFEAISRYLAPRRFIERRTATGSPSPTATRAWLEAEATRLAADRAARTAVRARIDAAAAGLAELEREVAGEA